MGIRFFLVARKTPPHAADLFPSDSVLNLGCPYMPRKGKTFMDRKQVENGN
jgi:hypothetical protein